MASFLSEHDPKQLLISINSLLSQFSEQGTISDIDLNGAAHYDIDLPRIIDALSEAEEIVNCQLRPFSHVLEAIRSKIHKTLLGMCSLVRNKDRNIEFQIKEINDLVTEVSRLEEQLKREQKRQSPDKQTIQLEERIATLEEENRVAYTDLIKIRDKNTKLQAQVCEFQAECTRLKLTESDLHDLKAVKKQLEEGHKEIIENFQSNIKSLEAEINSKNDELRKLVIKHQQEEAKCLTYESTVHELHEFIEELRHNKSCDEMQDNSTDISLGDELEGSFLEDEPGLSGTDKFHGIFKELIRKIESLHRQLPTRQITSTHKEVYCDEIKITESYEPLRLSDHTTNQEAQIRTSKKQETLLQAKFSGEPFGSTLQSESNSTQGNWSVGLPPGGAKVYFKLMFDIISTFIFKPQLKITTLLESYPTQELTCEEKNSILSLLKFLTEHRNESLVTIKGEIEHNEDEIELKRNLLKKKFQKSSTQSFHQQDLLIPSSVQEKGIRKCKIR